MMAFVNDEMTVLTDLIIHHALAHQALNESHVNQAVRLFASGSDATNFLGRQTQEC